MLFSSPDYPLFLIAVFFLYGLARYGGARHAWARITLMVMLADVVVMLVAKDFDALWDPIGAMGLRVLLVNDRPLEPWDLARCVVGCGVLAGAIAIGRRHVDWIVSPRGQSRIAIGFVCVIAVVGIVVGFATAMGTPAPAIHLGHPGYGPGDWPPWVVTLLEPRSTLDEVTRLVVAHAHLIVLFVLGIGIGATLSEGNDGGRRVLGRIVVLFVASSLFYHAWASAMPGPYRYLLFLLLGTIVLDYYLGIWIERSVDPVLRRLLVVVSLCSNLGILVFFKYTDFFIHDVLQLDGVERLNLILPAGISFHTFQSLSYTIDVYRKEIPATKSVVEFATFVLFFPQLVAGPIVRAQDLLPQLANPPLLELQKARDGLFRIVVGLFKKISLADPLALWLVDRVFEAPERYSSVEVICGVYAYALQIYLDFSAYSDIAIGSAMVLGFTLPENFRTPYRSANLQEFWRRWHISLSTWLRDYLYISLGGSRGAEWRTYLNLILTMLLGGLWHGASYAFIVWGALHGLGLAVTRVFQRETASDSRGGWVVFGICGAVAVGGVGMLMFGVAANDTWAQLAIAWLFLTPLWAVTTAWLGREAPRRAKPPVIDVLVELFRGAAVPAQALAAELLRIAMCVSGVVVLVALRYFEDWTWIPLVLVTWGLGVAADLVERGMVDWEARLASVALRALSIVLVFHYVCLAWVFFRATSFANALAVLRQIADGSTDHPNLIPKVTAGLVVGFLCHFFADGSFAWLKRRFVALPAVAQGGVLAAVAMVLRELAQHDIVQFIYFQF